MLNFYTELAFYPLAGLALVLYRVLSPRLGESGRAWLLALASVPFLLMLADGARIVAFMAMSVALLCLSVTRVRAGGRAWPWVVLWVWLLVAGKHPVYASWLPFVDASASGLTGWGWMGFSYFVFRAVDALFQARRDPGVGPAQCALLGLYFAPYVSGPVNRMGQLRKDLAAPDAPLDLERALSAVTRMCWGIVKILFLAKWAYYSSVAAPEFQDARLPGLPGLALGAWAYYLYIYFDFSGYTDVAVALSGLFGVKLPENFNRPFFAANIQEFWNRWHMSLSTWFRDYLFFPSLKTLRARAPGLHPQAAQAGALFLTFLAMGAWHGDGLNWVAYGLFHGLSMSLWALKRWGEDSLAPELFASLRANPFYRAGCVAFTFNYVCMGMLLMLDFDILSALFAG